MTGAFSGHGIVERGMFTSLPRGKTPAGAKNMLSINSLLVLLITKPVSAFAE
ncbi:hypothetical protein [Nitrobacter sp.]|uniref:hypothetical protein n=1 Tax=Nitrobacter sp. TaxID=29420 RepID=UPI0029CAC208|nr:hypothetical protein [Nitrobacter sp.]